jgi:hypothetical protein
MRLTVKFRTLCLAGVTVVAVLAAGEALARGGGHSAGGRGHGQHRGGGVHGGRFAHGDGRRAADFGGYWRRGFGRGGSYWGGYYGGGGVYYDDVGTYGDYAPDGPPANGGGPTIYAPNYYPAWATRLRPRSIRRPLTLATRQSCPMARIRTSSIFPPRGIAERARVAIDAWSDETLAGLTSASKKPRRRRQQPQSRQRDAIKF